ncbi:MAG: hypothetical protein MHM6MM_004925 [Cercozoa sp. M6MM]
MAIKQGKRKGKKGKQVKKDRFLSKELAHVKAPNLFANRNVGITVANRSKGNYVMADALKGRFVEVSLGDLNDASGMGMGADPFRMFRLKIEEVQGKECLTNFAGMRLTRDKLCSLIKKWRSTIEAYVDVKTADGYVLRVFTIGFTARAKGQKRLTSYANANQIKAVRARMIAAVQKEVEGLELKDFVKKLIPDSISQQIKKSCHYTAFPLTEVYVRKVKVVRAPKVDVNKLMDLHTGKAAESRLQKRRERRMADDEVAEEVAADEQVAVEETEEVDAAEAE